jgi:hypothetical protein
MDEEERATEHYRGRLALASELVECIRAELGVRSLLKAYDESEAATCDCAQCDKARETFVAALRVASRMEER